MNNHKLIRIWDPSITIITNFNWSYYSCKYQKLNKLAGFIGIIDKIFTTRPEDERVQLELV